MSLGGTISEIAPVTSAATDAPRRTSDIIVLSGADLRRLMQFGDYVEAVADAFRLHAEGASVLPEPMHIPADGGGFHVKAARLGGYVAVKTNSNFPDNARRGLPTMQGAVLLFDYVGKWRKAQKRAIEDADVAAVVAKLKKLHEDELFAFIDNGKVRDVKDRHVNDYIQSIISKNFTAKDFRTWAGTLLCSIALGMEGQGASKTERKRKIKRAVQATADQLGNTPAVCRSSYICPRLLDEYMEGKPFEMLRKHHKGSPVVRVGLSKEERALLKFLRETIADRRRRPRAA